MIERAAQKLRLDQLVIQQGEAATLNGSATEHLWDLVGYPPMSD